MNDEAIIAFFKVNSDLFINNSIADSTGRWFAWGFMKLVTWIADKCQALYDYSFGLVDFTSWSKVNNFISAFKPAFIAFLALALLALGIILILNHEKKPKILINIIIGILLISSGTVVFSQLNFLTKSFKEGVESISVSGEKFDGAYDVISNNMYDIVFLDKKLGMKNIDFKKNEKELPHPEITKNNFSYIDYREVLNPETDMKYKSQSDAESILEKKLVTIDYQEGSEKYELRDIYNGFGWNDDDDTDLANEFYYRYKFNFFSALLQLLSLIIIYVAMSYKCVRISFELVVARLFSYLYAAEISGGQKIVKILVFIRDAYILLIVTCLCIRLYYLFNAFIVSKIQNDFVLGVLCLFAAFVVIDGPNLVEKLLGMDAGLKSSTARMMAAYGVVKSAASGAMWAAKTGAGGVMNMSKSASDRLNEKMNSGVNSKEKMNSDIRDGKGEKDGNNGEAGSSGAGAEGKDKEQDMKPGADMADQNGRNAQDASYMDAAGEQEKNYMDAAGENEKSYMDSGGEMDSGAGANAEGSSAVAKEMAERDVSGDESFMQQTDAGMSESGQGSMADSLREENSFMNEKGGSEQSSFARPKSEFKSEIMDRLSERKEEE